jgi:hypothetical protein
VALIETYLQELEALKSNAALEGLQPADNSKTEFEFGRVCGVQEGVRLAEELFQKLLTDREQDAENRKSRSSRAT